MSFPLRLPLSMLKSPLRSAIKVWSLLFSDGMALSGRPTLEPLRLERDFEEIEHLFEIEQWPFSRADLEISHAQPRAVAFVARMKGKFAGFYAAHHFGDVGYLDMMIIPAEFRGSGVTRPLHARVLREMKARGLRSFVVHTTQDSAPLIRILGFRAGQTFTLLARDPAEMTAAAPNEAVVALDGSHLTDLVALDAAVFGMRRTEWLRAVLDQSSSSFYGLRRGGSLVASICLRARRGGAICLDGANASSQTDLEEIVTSVVRRNADKRLECFVRDGSDLDRVLRSLGFGVPEFFTKIGPLTEWRKGKTGPIGTSPRTQCLSWF